RRRGGERPDLGGLRLVQPGPPRQLDHADDATAPAAGSLPARDLRHPLATTPVVLLVVPAAAAVVVQEVDLGLAQPAAGRTDELVAHVADGADHPLVLGAELRPQPPDVHVDGAGAAEEVVA